MLTRLHQQFFGAGIVGETLLGKGADLQVDRPSVIALELTHRVEALERDARIDFDVGAHAAGAVDDGLLQRVPGAGVDVRFGECALGGCDRSDRFLERAALAATAVVDARFIEMDVTLDEARDHQAAIEFFGRCIGDNVLGNVDDAAAGDGDVDERLLGFGPPRLPQYEIDGHPAPGL